MDQGTIPCLEIVHRLEDVYTGCIHGFQQDTTFSGYWRLYVNRVKQPRKQHIHDLICNFNVYTMGRALNGVNYLRLNNNM